MVEGWVPVLSGRWNRPWKNPLHLTERRLALPWVNPTRIFRRPFLPLRVRGPSVCTVVTADGSFVVPLEFPSPVLRTVGPAAHTPKKKFEVLSKSSTHTPEKTRSRRTRFTHAKESRSRQIRSHIKKIIEVSKIPTPFCN
jgi:hypothetical protein